MPATIGVTLWRACTRWYRTLFQKQTLQTRDHSFISISGPAAGTPTIFNERLRVLYHILRSGDTTCFSYFGFTPYYPSSNLCDRGLDFMLRYLRC